MKCGVRKWGLVAAVLLAVSVLMLPTLAIGQTGEASDASQLEARVQQLEARVQQLENLAAAIEQLTKAVTDLQRMLAEQKSFKPEVDAGQAGAAPGGAATTGDNAAAPATDSTESASAAATAGRILVQNPDTVTKIIKLNDREFRIPPGSTRLNMNPYGPVELMQFENLPEDRNDWRYNEQDGVYELIVNLR